MSIRKAKALNIESCNIRETSVKDLEIITQFTLKLHQHEDDGEIPPHQNFSVNLRAWLSSGLKDSNALFLVAEKNQCPIGFISAVCVINDNGFSSSPIKGLIQLLWVEPEHRKNLTAEMLVKKVEACFKEMAIGVVECNYTSSNQLAESFWKKQGYKKSSMTARKIF